MSPAAPLLCPCPAPSHHSLSVRTLPEKEGGQIPGPPAAVQGAAQGPAASCGELTYLHVDVRGAFSRVVVIQGHHSPRRPRVPAALPASLCLHHKEKKKASMWLFQKEWAPSLVPRAAGHTWPAGMDDCPLQGLVLGGTGSSKASGCGASRPELHGVIRLLWPSPPLYRSKDVSLPRRSAQQAG